MTYTSAEANKLLRKLNEDHRALLENERMSYLFKAAMGEDPETLRPEYDFEKTYDELRIIEEQIRRVKHAINVFNSTTIVPEFDMTIDELLVYIPQLSSLKIKLSGMKSRLPKMRDNSCRNTNIIDYVYTNYDAKTVNEKYERISDRLARAQMALDKINTTATMEIDI